MELIELETHLKLLAESVNELQEGLRDKSVDYDKARERSEIIKQLIFNKSKVSI